MGVVVDQRYCLDTSFFINGWRKHWRIDVFPTLWKRLNEEIDGRQIFSCRAVQREIRHQRDDLCEWINNRPHMFEQPTGDHTLQMSEVMSKMQSFAAQGNSLNEADPCVIAHGILGRACVVTDETHEVRRPTKPPALPVACEFFGINWLSPLDFLARIGIKL
jgi:uncharacterized protein DUF4411